jgi:hypothetical protein
MSNEPRHACCGHVVMTTFAHQGHAFDCPNDPTIARDMAAHESPDAYRYDRWRDGL